MDEADDQADGETEDRRLHTVYADARTGTGRAQIVGHSRADQHAEGKNAGVAVAFPRHEQLAAGASSGECEGKAGGNHPKIVPQKVAVGHGLAFKAELEAARQGVRNECGGEHGRQPEEQVGVAEEEEVAERAHRAETAALREDADYEGQPQRSDEGGVL